MTAASAIFTKIFSPSRAGHAIESAPIVLFHDSLGCVELWRDFPQQLADASGRICFAYDRMGHGRSPARQVPPSFDFMEEEADFFLEKILPTTGIQTFVALGHSVGGGIAAIVASKSKDCVALITEGSQAFVEDRTRAGIHSAKASMEADNLLARLQRYHGDKAEDNLSAWMNIWLDPAYAGWSLEKWLIHISVPALIIHGDLDEYGSFRHPEIIASAVKGSAKKVLLRDTGHTPHRERPEETLGHIVGFLQGLV